MPKPPDPVWPLMRFVEREGGKAEVECKYCDWKIKTRNAPRAKTHLLACTKCPEVIKTMVKGMLKGPNSGDYSRSEDEDADDFGLDGMPSPQSTVRRPQSSSSDVSDCFILSVFLLLELNL